jgi:ribonuclease HI
MGVGIVVRNHVGEVLVTKCTTKAFVTDPQIAKAIAAWTAAELIHQLGLPQVILEGDALAMVQVMQQEESSWEWFGHLLEDAKLFLGSCRSWSVVHVKQTMNEAAHRMAKLGLELIAELIWRESVPLYIQQIVMLEQHLIR